MNKTNIEWTNFTSNPLKYRRKSDGKVVWACVKKSTGCSRCYAEAIALRFERGKLFNAKNMEELEPFLDEKELRSMRTYKPASGKRCFVGDMTDIFGEWVPDNLLDELFSSVLEIRTDVTWQLLTKRAERMRKYLYCRWGHDGRTKYRNIHIGVSVEDQAKADERVTNLLRTPATVRFLSCEPLLGPVNLERFLQFDPFHDNYKMTFGMNEWRGVDLVIVGGESGHGARPMNPDWARSIRDQCKEADNVSFFMKQMSGRAEIPEDLFIREFAEEIR